MAVSESWAEAQRAVIGALLFDPDHAAGEIFQTATAAHFGDPAVRHVFEAARGLWLQDQPIDPVTLQHAAGDEYKDLLAKCMSEMPTAANLGPWLKILRDDAQLSALQKDAMKMISSDVTPEIALQVYEHMGELLRGTDDVEDLSVTELIGEFIDRMRDKTPPNYLDWGIDKLNDQLYVEPGDFVILAGDSSSGKTALALQMAYHMAATGKRVGFFSIETTRQRLTDRLMAQKQVAGIELQTTKRKKLQEEDFRRAGEAGMRSDRIQLRVIRRTDSIQKIRARTLQHRFDVIFIDYVQLLSASGKERWEIVTEISIQLHKMAQQLGVTVVGLSQITPATKPGAKKQAAPTKDDLRESRQLKQDADAILILSPSGDEKDPPNTRILDIAKNKDGRIGKMKLSFDPPHMTFSPLITIDSLRSEGKAAKEQRLASAAEKRKKTAAEVPETKPGELRELPAGEEDLPF